MSDDNHYTEDQQHEMLMLARKSIEYKLNNSSYSLENIPEYLNKTRSCFVTLHKKNGQLRGCIGNIQAFESLYNNIIHNALNSAFSDPRFPKLQSIYELNSLKIEISVLTPKVKVDSYKDIVLGKHGIILRVGMSGSVFLPQVAPEQGWDISTTLSHLSIKAGLPPDAWKNKSAEFEVFEAIVFSE
ncbi:MAG: AmmeMemoRadiSam system protein A [Victivallales bacterium]|nr:AmmeMemoRadiSam system protein A [Victivallales bacterium]